jgi:dihydrofolate reductase (trimethoprim resistance protein)
MTMKLGQEVKKKSGREWQGYVVGSYSTELTPEGVCVESKDHKGSVQLYPAHALVVVESDGYVTKVFY